MSNTTLQTIDFSSMSPHKLYFLHGKNPETSDAVKEYLNSVVHYTTEWDQGHVDRRRGVYEMMPNIEKLTLSVYGFVNQVFYLRPSIKSIQMDFQLSFQEDKKYSSLEFLYPAAFHDWFREIEKFILKHPEGQLEELHINFMPEVKLHLCIQKYYTVDYDEYGPIYEDEDWPEDTKEYNPSDYLFMLTKDSRKDLEKIGEALLKLLSLKSWKAITLPSAFPCAEKVKEKYPFVKLTDEVKQEGLHERISSSLHKFHTDHKDELTGKRAVRIL